MTKFEKKWEITVQLNIILYSNKNVLKMFKIFVSIALFSNLMGLISFAYYLYKNSTPTVIPIRVT